MKRIFDGMFSHGELHFYPNTLEGVGAETILHTHRFPHVALFYPGDNDECRYEVFAIMKDGLERKIEIDAWGFVHIGAGVRHKIKLVSGDKGRFVCMFSHYGSDGVRRHEPKETL